MVDFIDSYELVMVNEERNLCTYQGNGMGLPNIDVILSSRGMSGKVSKWNVIHVTN